MPIYEYECKSCHHRFEKRQGFHDEPKADCPQCKGKSRRLIRPAPVIFKGKGFYVTDHRPAEIKNPASEPKDTGKETPAGKSEIKKEPSAGKDKSESASPKS
jgi:putative FmdB family regulatory protein